jgi:hypothetical protein
MAKVIEERKLEETREEAPLDDGLIEVSKDGVTLRVHPTALHDHRKNGWQ